MNKTVDNDRISKLSKITKPFIHQLYGDAARLEAVFLGNKWNFNIQEHSFKHAEYTYPTLSHAFEFFLNDLIKTINQRKKQDTLRMFAIKQ